MAGGAGGRRICAIGWWLEKLEWKTQRVTAAGLGSDSSNGKLVNGNRWGWKSSVRPSCFDACLRGAIRQLMR